MKKNSNVMKFVCHILLIISHSKAKKKFKRKSNILSNNGVMVTNTLISTLLTSIFLIYLFLVVNLLYFTT